MKDNNSKEAALQKRIDKLKYHVYFIGQSGTDYVKIGMSGDVDARLRQLQCGCPTRLRVLRIISVDDQDSARLLEAMLHKRYDSLECSASGEWYEINAARLMMDINFAVDLAYWFLAVSPVITDFSSTPDLKSIRFDGFDGEPINGKHNVTPYLDAEALCNRAYERMYSAANELLGDIQETHQ